MSIRQLISEGEHQHLDFKFRIDNAPKIARTLVAFANTEGGRLLVGVRDNGSVAGVRTDEEFYVVEAAAQLFSNPEIAFETRVWNVDQKSVLEIYVPFSANRPHRAKGEDGVWTAYFRNKDQNLPANGVMLKIWALGNRKRPAEWSYTLPESMLFNYLRENESISLSAFQRIAGIRRKKAEDTLARLVSWRVLEMKCSEKGCRFYNPEGLR